METEWAIHQLNREIDDIVDMITAEEEFCVRVYSKGVKKLHYHSNPKTLCTEDMVIEHGGCCGSSPHALLKATLTKRLAELNEKYPTSPLHEID